MMAVTRWKRSDDDDDAAALHCNRIYKSFAVMVHCTTSSSEGVSMISKKMVRIECDNNDDTEERHDACCLSMNKVEHYPPM
mmetsp:Transcript_34113/g.50119  ORF Transcript_34113/g.50119 Transcript_34113/m.50119 type:complete len:81 (-) Transcript_34113:158-400(-)